MGLPQKYNKIVRNHLRAWATWLPIVKPFRIGDFGTLEQGVFEPFGNLSDYGVDFSEEAGNDASLEFSSEGIRLTRFEAGAEVTAFSDQAIDARLEVSLERKNSMHVVAPTLNCFVMKDLMGVAGQLRTAQHKTSGQPWDHDFRIVRTLYAAQSAFILAGRAKGTKVNIGGSADALKQLELGNASAEFSINSTHTLSVEVTGDSGPVGVQLFRVLPPGDLALEAVGEAAADVETDDGWPSDLDDGDNGEE